MKKGLKVLSAAMALTFGLVGAGVVSAFPGEKLVPEEAKQPKVNPYYESIINEKTIKDSKDAKKAIDAVAQDAGLWSHLLNEMCKTASELSDAKAELAAFDALVAAAEDAVVPSGLQDEGNGSDKKNWASLNGKTVSDKALKALQGHKATDIMGFNVKPDMTAKEINEAIKKMVENSDELATVKNNYGTTAARNSHVATLQGKVKEKAAAMALLDQFTTKNGITFDAAKCADPSAMITSPALKKAVEEKKAETKKDTVPNTAAKSYFFAANCPKAEVAEKVVPMFKFADIANYDLFAPCAAEKTMDVVPNTGAAR